MIQSILEQFEALIMSILRLIWANADQFRSPGYLLLLLVIPVYLIWYYWWYDRRRLIVQISYDPKKIAPGRLNWAFLRTIPQILNLLALTLMIVALARPIWISLPAAPMTASAWSFLQRMHFPTPL